MMYRTYIFIILHACYNITFSRDDRHAPPAAKRTKKKDEEEEKEVSTNIVITFYPLC